MVRFDISRFFAVAALSLLAACAAPQSAPKPLAPTAPPPPPVAQAPLNQEQPDYIRLPNMAPGTMPVRVGVILPFSSANAATRALAGSMMKAAELAMFESKNSNILLMTADEGATPGEAGDAA